MAQPVKGPTRGFGSGRDLMVGESEPRVGGSNPCLGFSLSLSLCPSPAHTFPLKINKTRLKKKKGKETDPLPETPLN